MRVKGQRVYLLQVHENTGEERRQYGTVDRDDIPGWDYTDVRFDGMPSLAQPVVSWYLHDADE